MLERITGTAPPSDLTKVTFPEGFSRLDYSRIAAEVLPNFDATAYLSGTVGEEGYLFPETYFVPLTYTAAELAALQLETFEDKTQHLTGLYEEGILSENEVVILASIIEREANTPESMQIVAGILLNRIALGMPLQVDASIEYVLDKPLSQLVPEDLEMESPYNTYLNAGLPPTPIGNPGLTAIEAVLYPTGTEYLFYITGDDGNFYYAETFDQHRANISRHLQ